MKTNIRLEDITGAKTLYPWEFTEDENKWREYSLEECGLKRHDNLEDFLKYLET